MTEPIKHDLKFFFIVPVCFAVTADTKEAAMEITKGILAAAGLDENSWIEEWRVEEGAQN